MVAKVVGSIPGLVTILCGAKWELNEFSCEFRCKNVVLSPCGPETLADPCDSLSSGPKSVWKMDDIEHGSGC